MIIVYYALMVIGWTLIILGIKKKFKKVPFFWGLIGVILCIPVYATRTPDPAVTMTEKIILAVVFYLSAIVYVAWAAKVAHKEQIEK